MITVALPKGGLLKDCIQLFQSVGLDFSAFLDKDNRQLQIVDPTNRAKALLVRNHDVPVYVEYGQAQLGIVGYETLETGTAEAPQRDDGCDRARGAKKEAGTGHWGKVVCLAAIR